MVNTVKFNRKEWMKEWFANLSREEKDKRNYVRTLKRRAKKAYWVTVFGSTCHDCNKSYPDCVYEFHHLDPTTKDRTPALLFMLSDKRIKDELDKCIMLCANCHRIRHAC